MHLYHLTLQKPTSVTCSVYGNFSGAKEHEIVVARGSNLELLKQDAAGKLQTILSVNTFSGVRSLSTYRLIGQTVDYLVVGSDSGRITILEYRKDVEEWVKLHQETFGKTGARRITPGQFVAREPSGRAILVAAVEKQKFIYMMDRDSTGKLTISSPLEAPKTNTLLFDVIGLDNGVDNPQFACIEMDYSDVDTDATGEAAKNVQKSLVYYELDLSVKNMVRKWSCLTDAGANALIMVPGGSDGPGGCIVLAENWILYQHQGQTELRTAIPRRADYPNRGLLLTAHTVFRSKAGYFALAQSECGDLYKITIETREVVPGQQTGPNGQISAAGGKIVTELRVKYFDTLPVASSLAITRNGLLFVASESGNQLLMSFASLGDDDTEAAEGLSIKQTANADEEVVVSFEVFSPRPLRNLVKVDEMSALGPVTDLTAMIPASDAHTMMMMGGMPSLAVPQLVTACGRGTRSTLRVLQQGTHVAEIGRSGMPGAPVSVFTLKGPESASGTAGPQGSYPDKYILLSFSNATVTMAVGDSIEEVSSKTTGLVDDAPTLAAGVMADGSMVQVTPSTLRRIPFTAAGTSGTPMSWSPQARKIVVRAAINTRQVILALSGGEIIYFEYEQQTRQLREVKRIVLPGAEVAAIALPPVPEGAVRSPFVAIADSNNMARILSLDPSKVLEQTSGQALRAGAESLALVTMKISGPIPQMHLFIGLVNGVLTRLVLDTRTGLLSDPRVRYLGMKPVKLTPVTVAGTPGLLALSHRPYVAYNWHGKYHLQPLCYDALDAAAPLMTEALPEAFVAVAGNSLRIFSLDSLGHPFHSSSLPLEHTPRRMAMHYPTGLAVLIESDHNALTASGRAAETAALKAEMGDDGDDHEGEGQDMETEDKDGALKKEDAKGDTAQDVSEGDPIADGVDSRRVHPSPPSAEDGRWASVVRLVDLNMVSAHGGPITDRAHPCVHARLELEQDEAAFSVACVAFHDAAPLLPGMPASAAQSHDIAPGEQIVVVGIGKGLTYHPQFALQKAYLNAYKVSPETVKLDPTTGAVIPAGAAVPEGAISSVRYSLRLLHRTEVEALPLTMTSFQGMLLVGVGRVLRMYELGRKQLLRKCEARGFPTIVKTLSVSVDRVFVGDGQESVHFCKYKRAENSLHIFADDTQPRHMTCTVVLDHDTVAGGDKFGNVFVLRLPSSVSDEVDAIGPTGSRLLWDSGKMGGAPTKATMIAQFHVGAAITSLSKAVLTTGGSEVLVYTTVNGAIGSLLPLGSKEDADFYTHMELFLRAEDSVSATGRDHLSYRSLYGPVSHVIDGDLCEAYATLSAARQKAIATDLDRNGAHEVLKKLEDVRNRVM